jgi:hypothetical protein
MSLSDSEKQALTDAMTLIHDAQAAIDSAQVKIGNARTAVLAVVNATPPPPPPPPSGDWLSRIGNKAAAVTGPTNRSDMPSTYSGTRLTVQQMFEHGWNAGFRSAEDLQILAAIGLAESSGDVGCRNWHPTFGFKVPGEPVHLAMTIPAGAYWTDANGNKLVMRSDRGCWQISDHFYPGCYDAECDDPATAAKMVKWIRDNRGGWQQWDTFIDGSYRNKVALSAAQQFVASKG